MGFMVVWGGAERRTLDDAEGGSGPLRTHLREKVSGGDTLPRLKGKSAQQ